MLFKDLSTYLEKLEHTTSRNSMIEILSDLFKKADAKEIDKIVYLMQGRVAPLYEPIEFKMADKMILRSIALAYNVSDKEAARSFRTSGDIGEAAERFAKEKNKTHKNLSVSEVFSVLEKVTASGGEGSVDVKLNLTAELLKDLDPLSARYVVRIPVGRLRLGFSDMTVLDSLSWMLKGDKSKRPAIEKVYNIYPDLGVIAKTVKEKGVAGLSHLKPEVFTPILMARAERLSSGEEIIEKIGKCAVEPKYDGFRLQVHYKAGKVKLITRNLEDSTFMYPDVVEGLQKQIKAIEAILEGEAIAYNPDTGEFLPFQETVQRKRKYGIAEKALSVPLKLICFELLYVNGKSFIDEPYAKRREELNKIIGNPASTQPASRQGGRGEGDVIMISQEKVINNPHDLENEFDDAVSRGLEGIVAKKLDGTYQAGARGWNWIKFKRSYSAKLEDTVDALVLGYYSGKGKRTAFGIGAFLIGIYDSKEDKYLTIARIGTGLTDEEWRELRARCLNLKSKEKPPLYEVDKMLTPDFWVEPSIIVEIKADEITRSPIHTAGRVMKASKSGSAFDVDIPGYALRFPRLQKFRDDRKPEDVTSLKEIEDMFVAQRPTKEKKSEN